MAGLTPLHLTLFRRSLRARGLDLEQLAGEVGCSRHHLSQILNGHFKGESYWARIRACVTAEEWALLLDIEHCSAWNTQALAAGEDAMVWEFRRQCYTCGERLGFKSCIRMMAGTVTHGLCPDCFQAEREKIAAYHAAREAAERPRPYLVETEAGLAVHCSATGDAPAMASNRELTIEHFACAGGAAEFKGLRSEQPPRAQAANF